METYATITPHFQIHLPVNIRKISGITSHGRVKVKATKGTITIMKPKKNLLAWAGKFKVKNPIPADKIRDLVNYGDI